MAKYLALILYMLSICEEFSYAKEQSGKLIDNNAGGDDAMGTLIALLQEKFNGKPTNPLKLIIDHDGGTDDAMAIFMALIYEEHFNGPEVVGLTTNHGNVYEDQVFLNSQRLLDIAKRREVPIYRGAKESLVKHVESDFFFGQDGLGDSGYHTEFLPVAAKADHAVMALINLSKEYEGQLVVITIGSLTNIALAIRLDRDFIQRLSHLYVAAGNVYSENVTEAEFNALVDVEAYYAVAAAATPDKVTIIPFSQTNSSLHVPKEWRTDVLGAIDTEKMRALNAFENLTIDYHHEWDMLDPTAMAVVLNETLIIEELYSINHSIVLCDEQRGINTNEFGPKEASNVRVVNAIDEEPFKQLLIDIFSSEL